MGTSLTRFELQIPIYDNLSQPTQYNAIQNFLAGLAALTTYISSEGFVNGNIPQIQIVYGLITVAQQSAALNLLNTLNSALVGASSPTVLCTINTVQTQP